IAVLAGDERILAGAGRREEVDAELPAHDPALGLDVDRLDPAALEDPPVRLTVRLEAPAHALLVAIERVPVLHHEFAQSDQRAAWRRLLAILRLKVVPELGQLPVRADPARMECERLLVRQREDVAPAGAVLEVEELRDPGPAGRLPELDRRQYGRQHLLSTDR